MPLRFRVLTFRGGVTEATELKSTGHLLMISQMSTVKTAITTVHTRVTTPAVPVAMARNLRQKPPFWPDSAPPRVLGAESACPVSRARSRPSCGRASVAPVLAVCVTSRADGHVCPVLLPLKLTVEPFAGSRVQVVLHVFLPDRRRNLGRPPVSAGANHHGPTWSYKSPFSVRYRYSRCTA